jgi:nitrate reductase NapAB chaperone NapD
MIYIVALETYDGRVIVRIEANDKDSAIEKAKDVASRNGYVSIVLDGIISEQDVLRAAARPVDT